MIFRALAALMALLFAFAAAVNFNDPDPVRWIAMYGAACMVSAGVALRGTLPVTIPSLIGAIALTWAVLWASRVPGDAYKHMFDQWEMTSVTVEEARETCGLLIAAIWMALIVIRLLLRSG